MRNTPITRVMTPDPVTVSPSTPVEELRPLLEYGGLHHLPVVAGGRLVGLVSSADLLKLYLLDGSDSLPDGIAAESIMARDPRTVDHRASVRTVAETLAGGGFHALPVVGDQQELVGIVTSSDLNDFLLRNLPSGDGSLDATPPVTQSGALLGDSVIVEGLRQLKLAADDDEIAAFARALLAERRTLDGIRQAAELYFRSGQAERELSKLRKVLAAARTGTDSILL